jgi:hypothetical protein
MNAIIDIVEKIMEELVKLMNTVYHLQLQVNRQQKKSMKVLLYGNMDTYLVISDIRVYDTYHMRFFPFHNTSHGMGVLKYKYEHPDMVYEDDEPYIHVKDVMTFVIMDSNAVSYIDVIERGIRKYDGHIQKVVILDMYDRDITDKYHIDKYDTVITITPLIEYV